MLVHGSLYTVDEATRSFTGGVERLNVTLIGKREVVLHCGGPVVAAIGNSRPDRALFEAVVPGGLRALVCPRAVLERRSASFVVRKLERSGTACAGAPTCCWTIRGWRGCRAPRRRRISAGSTWSCQAWFRDPAAGGAGFGSPDGLEIPFVP